MAFFAPRRPKLPPLFVKARAAVLGFLIGHKKGGFDLVFVQNLRHQGRNFHVASVQGQVDWFTTGIYGILCQRHCNMVIYCYAKYSDKPFFNPHSQALLRALGMQRGATGGRRGQASIHHGGSVLR